MTAAIFSKEFHLRARQLSAGTAIFNKDDPTIPSPPCGPKESSVMEDQKGTRFPWGRVASTHREWERHYLPEYRRFLGDTLIPGMWAHTRVPVPRGAYGDTRGYKSTPVDTSPPTPAPPSPLEQTTDDNEDTPYLDVADAALAAANGDRRPLDTLIDEDWERMLKSGCAAAYTDREHFRDLSYAAVMKQVAAGREIAARAKGEPQRSAGQLNGRNGEHTGLDDVRTVSGCVTGGHPIPPPGPIVRANTTGEPIMRQAETPRVGQPHVVTFEEGTVATGDPFEVGSGVCPCIGDFAEQVPSALLAICDILGKPWAEVTMGNGNVVAVWTCPAMKGVTGHGGRFYGLCGEGPFLVAKRTGQHNKQWAVYEYALPSESERIHSLTVEHPWLIRYSRMSLFTLLHLVDVAEGVDLGTTANLHSGTPDGLSTLRFNVLNAMAQVAEEERYAAHASGLHERPTTWGVCVRDHALNGSNGSATNTDDVNPKGQKPGPKKYQKAKRIAQQVVGAALGAGASTAAHEVGVPQLASAAAKAGNRVGGEAVSRVWQWLGWGRTQLAGHDHNGSGVKANSILSGSAPPAAIEWRGEICADVVSTDFVGTVKTGAVAGAFTLIKILINPGNQLACPQAFSKTQGYEQYIPKGLMVEFNTTFGTISSGALGSVNFCFDRDTTTADPLSVEDMSRREGFFQVVPDKNANYFVECAPQSWMKKNYLIWGATSNQSSSTVSPSDYDCGVLYIGIQPAVGLGALTSIGSLMLRAHWSVGRPRATNVISGYAHFRRTNYSNTSPLGTSVAESIGTAGVRTGVLSDVYTSGGTLYLKGVPNGTSLILTIRYAGTGAATISYPPTVYSNCAAILIQAGQTSGDEVSPLATTSSTVAQRTITLQTSNDLNIVPYITFGTTGTLPTSVQGVEIVITTLMIGGTYGVTL